MRMTILALMLALLLSACGGEGDTAGAPAADGPTAAALTETEVPFTERDDTARDEELTSGDPRTDANLPGREVHSDTSDDELTVAEVVEAADTYLGTSVTVQGSVDELIAASAFTLDENTLGAGGVDNDLLVLSAEVADAQLTDVALDDEVRVTGEVRRLTREAIVEMLGGDPGDGLTMFGDERLVIMAATVQRMEVRLPSEQESAAGLAEDERPERPAEIIEYPNSYLGETVVVRGEVDALLSDRVLTLDEDAVAFGGLDNDLLVLGAADTPAFDPDLRGTDVIVIGTVRRLDTALEAEVGYTIDGALLAKREGLPVLIAESVRPAE
jgi:hypothetical protein